MPGGTHAVYVLHECSFHKLAIQLVHAAIVLLESHPIPQICELGKGQISPAGQWHGPRRSQAGLLLRALPPAAAARAAAAPQLHTSRQRLDLSDGIQRLQQGTRALKALQDAQSLQQTLSGQRRYHPGCTSISV